MFVYVCVCMAVCHGKQECKFWFGGQNFAQRIHKMTWLPLWVKASIVHHENNMSFWSLQSIPVELTWHFGFHKHCRCVGPHRGIPCFDTVDLKRPLLRDYGLVPTDAAPVHGCTGCTLGLTAGERNSIRSAHSLLFKRLCFVSTVAMHFSAKFCCAVSHAFLYNTWTHPSFSWKQKGNILWNNWGDTQSFWKRGPWTQFSIMKNETFTSSNSETAISVHTHVYFTEM